MTNPLSVLLIIGAVIAAFVVGDKIGGDREYYRWIDMTQHVCMVYLTGQLAMVGSEECTTDAIISRLRP